MSYSASITRKNPALLLILLDCSGSMQENTTFLARRMAKAEASAIAVNMYLEGMLDYSKREEGYRDYFDLMVLGYSGAGVESLLSPEGALITMNHLDRLGGEYALIPHETTLESGNTLRTDIRQRIWIHPRAEGNTPMLQALEKAQRHVGSWCTRSAHRDAYPPTVINITDGEASDGDEQMIALACKKIRQTATSDGNTILMNIHISSTPTDEEACEICFPSSPEQLPDNRYARMLFSASSLLPEKYCRAVDDYLDCSTEDGRRAMCFNCPSSFLLSAMNIGSISVSQIR